nr:hypothetical protein [Tanacetum cinerariifolium]
ERVKIFSDGVLAVDKCFPDIPTKPRSRLNGLSGVSRMGPPNVINVNQQKAEERGINTPPNKRTRTSKVDVRPNTRARSSVTIEKDREALRGPTSNGVPGEDQASHIVADGWENAKMKRKRSVIKADAASSTSFVSSQSNDGYREPKQGIYPRNLPDSRSRRTDTFGSRPGAASISAHSSAPKPEQESKNSRVVNKIGVREEYTAGGPTNAKLHAPARGPRSGSMALARFSTVRATTSNDRELPNIASKNSGPVAPTNGLIEDPKRYHVPQEPILSRLQLFLILVFRVVFTVNELDRILGDPQIGKLIHTKNLPVLGSIQSVVPTTKPDVDSSGDIRICQRLLSALIPEDGDDNENDDTESNGF